MTAAAPTTGTIAVVGAGLAGLSAVRALRAQGYQGRIVLLGRESHAPYDRPPLSKEFLAGALPLAGLSLAAPDDADLDVDVRLGRTVVALHPNERTVEVAGGERVGGDGVVIATGARARSLPGPALTGVHTLRTLDDAIALRAHLVPGARLVVIGAGFIGAEVASTAHGLGVDVQVVEAAQVPLAAVLGERMGAICAGLHADHGVDLVTGVPVDGLVPGDSHGSPEDAPAVRAVRLADGRDLPADLVLVAVGSVPNVEWLAGSGLQADGGVLTDARGATAVPGIVATGDCARRYEPAAGRPIRQEHWTNALQHPPLAVSALLGLPPPVQPASAAVPYFWSDQYGVRLQFAGHHHPGDDVEVVDGNPEAHRYAAVYRRDGVPVAVLAMDDPRVFVRWRRQLADALPAQR